MHTFCGKLEKDHWILGDWDALMTSKASKKFKSQGRQCHACCCPTVINGKG